MRPTVMMERIADASPRLKARIAGALYLLSFLTAALSELLARGSLNFAGGLIAVLGMLVVTLLQCRQSLTMAPDRLRCTAVRCSGTSIMVRNNHQ